MKRIVLLLLLTMGVVRSNAQDVISSSTYIETCMENTQCVLVNNSGYLFYDNSKSALYLKVDFKGGEDSVIDWLKDLTETYLYFKVTVPPDFFAGTSNYNQKSLKLTGQVFLNNIWQPQTVDILLLTSENSNIVINPGSSPYDNYKISFSLALLPADFKVNEKPHHLRETISISLGSGRVNELKPGMESILGEAYNHE